MAGPRGFRYALEPVLLTRQWALDALLRELADCNALLAQRRAAHAAVQAQLAQASADWQRLGADGAPVSVDRYALLSRYLAERAGQGRALALAVAEQEQARDGLIAQVAAARRGVDAVQRDRERRCAQFVRAGQSAACKVADDQWNGMQARREQHDD